jgi:hypothetical protein
MKTHEIARAFADERKARRVVVVDRRSGKPVERHDTDPWILEDLRVWIAENVTKESPWYWSGGPEPEFVKVGRRVLAYYRRHGWTRRDGQCYEWRTP